MVEKTIWEYIFLGNTTGSYTVAILIFIGLSILFRIIQGFVLARLERVAEKNKSKAADVFIHIFDSIKPPFYYFLAFFLSLNYLSIDPPIKKFIHVLLIIWVVYEAILCIQIFIDYLVRRSVGPDREKEAKSAVGMVRIVSSFVLWFIGILFIFSNLGINITSLVAGLGITGIAVALGVQNILKDLFSSFAIYFDKPFVIGDYISVGDVEGTVKAIGIKTSRLTAPQGEEIVISNQDLTSLKIKNFSKPKERHSIFNIKLDYETSNSKIEKAIELIREAIEETSEVKSDRINVIKFDKSGIDIEAVYLTPNVKYIEYLSLQQSVLLAVKEKLDKEKIKLA